MAKIITYVCPSCGGQILHDDESKSDYEICSFCGTKHALSSLGNDTNISGTTKSDTGSSYMGATGGSAFGGANGDAMVTYIDESESALAYLENFFENYDWDSFCNYAALSIPAVDRMVDKMLVKSAANPATWELQFTALITPLVKKIAGLKTLEEKFFQEYIKNDDLAESFTYFDTYSNIVKRVVASGNDIIKKLTSAVKYYKKYKGSEAVAKQLNAQLDAITQRIGMLKPVSDYKELPGYAKANAEKQKKAAARLAERGINAEEVYGTAVAEYEAGGDPRHALAMFMSIAGYKDAQDYANKLDGWFRFDMADGTVIKLGKKHYILNKAIERTFTVSDPAGTAPQPPKTQKLNMYEVVKTRQATDPCVTGITDLLTYFGGTLVYVKNSTEICMYNSVTGKETSIIEVNRKNDIKFVRDNDGYILLADNKLFVLCKLDAVKKTEEKKGGLAGLFGKKKPSELVVVTKNNFSLITINLETGDMETVIQELVDIQELFGEEIFYNKSTVVNNKEKDELYAYNYVTKNTRKVLSTDTEIVDVIDGNVIYFVWAPNDYNKDLHALNLESNVDTVLATNVYDYYGCIDSKAYYYVGNYNRAALYSVDVDGGNRTQIRSNAGYFGKALYYRNGWLYLTVGQDSSYNYALAKLKANGEGFTVLCPKFKSLVEIKDGYVYYVDKGNNLCMVREDGSERKILIDGLEGFVHIAANGIYMLRREVVDENNGKPVRANSLYRVGYDGAGLTKIAFNVVNAAINNSDKNEIYLYKAANVKYSIQTPIDKDNYTTTYETRTRKTITVYNIAEDTFTDIAVFGDAFEKGAPLTFKAGCFKKVQKEIIVTEIKSKKTFRRTDKLKAGSIANEQLEEARAAEAQTAAPTQTNNNSGCALFK